MKHPFLQFPPLIQWSRQNSYQLQNKIKTAAAWVMYSLYTVNFGKARAMVQHGLWQQAFGNQWL